LTTHNRNYDFFTVLCEKPSVKTELWTLPDLHLVRINRKTCWWQCFKVQIKRASSIFIT